MTCGAATLVPFIVTAEPLRVSRRKQPRMEAGLIAQSRIIGLIGAAWKICRTVKGRAMCPRDIGGNGLGFLAGRNCVDCAKTV